jgi:hypothetical protein
MMKVNKVQLAFRHLGELCPQSLKIDKCRKEGRDLHAGYLNEAGNKLLKRDKTWRGRRLVQVDLVRSVRRSRWCWTCT